MNYFDQIFEDIKSDPDNAAFTASGILPLYSAWTESRICLIGQAPGLKAQETKLFWNDPSGDRLREWTGISRDVFYSSKLISIMPMDFYFPGKGKSGDKPPRKSFAPKWHPQLLNAMPSMELIILIGSYAQAYYLDLRPNVKITDVIHDYQQYLPKYLPIVHPSPRNNIWLRKNPWFEDKVIPDLQQRVKDILSSEGDKSCN